MRGRKNGSHAPYDRRNRQYERDLSDSSNCENSDVEIVEKRVEVVQKVQKEKIVEVTVVEQIEKIIEVPKIEIVEKIVEVPQLEVVEVPVEKIVEIPQIEIVEKIVEVPIDQHVEVEVEVVNEVEVINDVDRFIPVSYDTVQPYEFVLPQLKPNYERKKMTFLTPRFVQVPVPSYLLTEEQKTEMRELGDLVERLANHPSPSLSDIEQVTHWLVQRQAELEKLHKNPVPTKVFMNRAMKRVPTNLPDGGKKNKAELCGARIAEAKIQQDAHFFSIPRLSNKATFSTPSLPQKTKTNGSLSINSVNSTRATADSVQRQGSTPSSSGLNISSPRATMNNTIPSSKNIQSHADLESFPNDIAPQQRYAYKMPRSSNTVNLRDL